MSLKNDETRVKNHLIDLVDNPFSTLILHTSLVS